ncbi:MAG: hypothetical protein ACXVSL_14530 [Solirubrobacteraceae bacterium]
MSRQLEPASGTRTRAPNDDASSLTPASGRSGSTILDFQRAYGNRQVARWVLSRQPALADTATVDNRDLGKAIDEIRKLDWATMLKRHEEVEAALAAGPTGAELARLSLVRDAIDFVRSERMIGGRTPAYPGSATNSALAMRGAAEREIQHHGSVDFGLDAFEERFPDSEEAKRQADQIRAERDAFAKQFESQNRRNANQLLEQSMQSIYALMRDYGLPRRTWAFTEDTDKFKDLADDWVRASHTDAEYGTEQAARHRQRLAQWVSYLHDKQVAVWDADSQAKSDVDDPVETKRVQDHARNELAAAWLQAERLHPILAAYRQDKELERVDLYGISFEGDEAMRNVMLHLLPTMGNIMEAKRWLSSGKLNPLTLAPVVELTRHNMFIPRGSVRDAVVMDLVADAGPSKLLMVITLALTLVLLLPTGGASAVIAGGLLALDVYSAGTQIIQYGRQKALRGTDLDRARSLSDEDPSLTGVIISLVSVGLSGAQLLSVFRQVQAVRNLAAAGRDTDAAVKALNKVGEDVGAGDIGTQAANSGRRARTGGSTAADKPPTPDAPTSTPKKPATTDEPTLKPGDKPTPKPDEPTTAPKGDKPTPKTDKPSGRVPTQAPVIEEMVLGYGSRAEVVKDVKNALAGIKGDMPRSWQLVKDALAANGGKANGEILAVVDKYMGALRNPKHWAEVMGDAWELAAKMPKPDIREALLQLAKKRLGTPLEIPNKIFEGGEFFEKYVASGRPLVDQAFKGKAHGELTHLIQDLVLDKAFGAGTSSSFRRLLGQAEGEVTVWTQAAKTNTVKLSPYGAHSRSGANTTFLEGETRMRTGDYVWRWTYDLLYEKEALRRLPQPEAVGPKLDELLDVP